MNKVTEVLDSSGKVIKFHDVCQDLVTKELILIEKGVNTYHGICGLVAVNNYIGLHDWLDVYPNGALKVLGNVDYMINNEEVI